MDIQNRAVLLVGSPRGAKSTSELLGSYLAKTLKENGTETEKMRLYDLMGSDEGQIRLLSFVAGSDILVLVFPLYVDSLPALATKALELISANRASGELRRCQLVAIANNGFPEAYQNDTALAICRRFAKEAGMEWAGSLGVGGGECIGIMADLLGRRPLEKLGFICRKERKALDRIAELLASGAAGPQEMMEFRTNRPMPAWMYKLGATVFKWRPLARQNGVWKRLHDRPYQNI